MKVRKYLAKDFEDVRRICFETCEDKFLKENPQVLWAKYADYYTLNEPENIFVLVDDNDKCQGYILCSTDSNKYRMIWKSDWKNKIKVKGGLYQRMLQVLTLIENKNMAKKGFGAHLHIDISPNFQHAGGGTKLVDELLTYLKEKQVDGVHLSCGEVNKVGTNFYKKYGFKIHHHYFGCNVFIFDLKV